MLPLANRCEQKGAIFTEVGAECIDQISNHSLAGEFGVSNTPRFLSTLRISRDLKSLVVNGIIHIQTPLYIAVSSDLRVGQIENPAPKILKVVAKLPSQILRYHISKAGKMSGSFSISGICDRSLEDI